VQGLVVAAWVGVIMSGPPEGPKSEDQEHTLEPGAASEAVSTHRPDIRVRLEIDLPIFVGFVGVFGATEGFKSKIAPASCRWCETGRGELAIRDALVWRKPDAAALSSDLIAYAGLPVFALALTLTSVGREKSWRHLHEDLLVAFEAVAISAALTNTIKFGVGRQRPYATFSPTPISFTDDPDQNLGFPSGHTSFAFSLATSFATVATLRERKLAPVLWGVGVPVAGFVGYLRMAGDRHWFGDVLAGAGLGTLIGVGVPWLLHHPRTGIIPRAQARARGRGRDHAGFELQVLPAPGGVSVSGRM